MSTPTPPDPPRLAILAGSGSIPVAVASAAERHGRTLHIFAIEGITDRAIEDFSHTWLRLGQLGRLLKGLKRTNCGDLVIVGGMRRPDLWTVRPDLVAIWHMPTVLRWTIGGDDQMLSRIVGFFETRGLRVVGAHEIDPGLLAGVGRLGKHGPRRRDEADIELGLRVIGALGEFDVGQSVVVVRQHVLAVEGAEGTDRMLLRCSDLKQWGDRVRGGLSGVMVKCAKPGQERRVDLPTVGPETVRRAAEAGLAGIAIAANDVLIADREGLLAEADARGLFVLGVSQGEQISARGSVSDECG